MSAETPSDIIGSILERYKWKKVLAPKTWLPKVPGTELVGFCRDQDEYIPPGGAIAAFMRPKPSRARDTLHALGIDPSKEQGK